MRSEEADHALQLRGLQLSFSFFVFSASSRLLMQSILAGSGCVKEFGNRCLRTACRVQGSFGTSVSARRPKTHVQNPDEPYTTPKA